MVGGGDCPSAASLFVYQQTIDLPPKHGGVGAPSHDGKDGSACSDFIIAVVRLGSDFKVWRNRTASNDGEPLNASRTRGGVEAACAILRDAYPFYAALTTFQQHG
jgi:hypothetical protein